MPFKAEISPIASANQSGVAYLEIVPYDGGVRVQRTDAGRRSLNPFWTVWLRQLILEKADPKHSFAVELRDSDVFVSSSSTPEGLMETVRAFGCRIHPLPLPMRRRHASTTSRWMSWDTEVDLSEPLKLLSLPGGKFRTWATPLHAVLERDQRNKFQIGTLGLMVECHIARTLNAADMFGA